MVRKPLWLLLLLVLAIAPGCALMDSIGPAPATDNAYQMTPLEKAKMASVYFTEVYKSQSADAWAMWRIIEEGRATDVQKRIYAEKRRLLIKAEPLVKTFAALVGSGTIPPPGKEQEINDILNELLAATAKMGG
jgi:hypothetical protein